SASNILRARDTGPFGFLLTPCDERELKVAIEMAVFRHQMEMEREALIHQLQTALAQVKALSGLLPICAECKKVRDDGGYWSQVEAYIEQRTEARFPTGPPDPNLRRCSWRCQDLDRAVLRPISGTAMNFPDGSLPRPRLQTHLRAHSRRVARRAFQPYAQARFGARVVIKSGLRTVLRHHQIDSSVSVVVAERRPALFSVNLDPGLLPRYRTQSPRPVPQQQQATARIQPRNLRLRGKKILAEENALVTVAIKIRNVDTERRGELRLGRQRHRVEMVAAIQKQHRSQSSHPQLMSL